MELSNRALERAAVAAENWSKEATDKESCERYYITESGFGWPAVAASKFKGTNNEARANKDVWSCIQQLFEIHGFYIESIDEGRGDKVAAVFRAEKRRRKQNSNAHNK